LETLKWVVTRGKNHPEFPGGWCGFFWLFLTGKFPGSQTQKGRLLPGFGPFNKPTTGNNQTNNRQPRRGPKQGLTNQGNRIQMKVPSPNPVSKYWPYRSRKNAQFNWTTDTG